MRRGRCIGTSVDTNAEQPFGRLGDRGAFLASVATRAASRRRREPVGLQHRLWPGAPFSKRCNCALI